LRHLTAKTTKVAFHKAEVPNFLGNAHIAIC
jgi:hypothetical protein